MINIGDLAYRRKTDNHGCREDEVVKIESIINGNVSGIIVESYVCTSCWQTGCVDDGRNDGDTVGRYVDLYHVEETENGLIEYRYLVEKC